MSEYFDNTVDRCIFTLIFYILEEILNINLLYKNTLTYAHLKEAWAYKIQCKYKLMG